MKTARDAANLLIRQAVALSEVGHANKSNFDKALLAKAEHYLDAAEAIAEDSGLQTPRQLKELRLMLIGLQT